MTQEHQQVLANPDYWYIWRYGIMLRGGAFQMYDYIVHMHYAGIGSVGHNTLDLTWYGSRYYWSGLSAGKPISISSALNCNFYSTLASLLKAGIMGLDDLTTNNIHELGSRYHSNKK